jgi:hypothetical protein
MATVIDSKIGIQLFQMRSQLAALGMEVRTGMKFSSKGSLNKHIRMQYGIKPTRKVAVWKALYALILEKEKEAKVEPREANDREQQILDM